jgi:hypothetical protein
MRKRLRKERARGCNGDPTEHDAELGTTLSGLLIWIRNTGVAEKIWTHHEDEWERKGRQKIIGRRALYK